MNPTGTKSAKKFVTREAFQADADTHSILKSLVETKQQELKDLNALMTREHVLLSQIRNDQRLEKQKFDQQLREERRVFDAGLEGERRRLANFKRDLEGVQQETQAQRTELELLFAQAEQIRAERAAAVEARIKMEQQRIRAEELRSQAEASLHQLHAAQSTAQAIHDAQAEERQKLDALTIELANQQETLETKANAVALDLEQVTALRHEIDPKLDQLAQREQALLEHQRKLDLQQRSFQEQRTAFEQTRVDLQGLSQRLEAQTQQCHERELRLQQQEADLRVKIQQAKSKGIE